jgi:tetratricopeptide (TPR) repeat protein
VLGVGGMGVVYEAEQENPARRVALKVLKPGLVTVSLLRRFEYEARVLGWLNHPGIAQIYEAGTDDTGNGPQPFFAMELVRGVPLTRYAKDNGLSTEQRLELLAKVCDAVQHAHQKGVVHRDLKPGNVLVDPSGQPKVVDFGVARVTDADLQATTVQTAVGELVGTLTYMSPEQVGGQPDAVDTRSDVYALGVIAHELLAGRPPFDLRGKMVHEAARAIVEDEPSTLGALNAALRGDVETIVAKSLEKDKERRYASAEELARDIRRFLDDEPIVARPASAAYQLTKFARRNKTLVSGLAVAMVALLAGTVTSTWLYLDAEDARTEEKRQKELAQDARDRAIDAEADSTAAATRARAEAQKANQVKDFLVELFTMANPYRAKSEVPTLRSVLDEGAETLYAGLEYEPNVRAELLSTVGYSYQALFLPEQAARYMEEAVEVARTLEGRESRELLAVALRRLGRLRLDLGQPERGLVELREARELAVELWGEGHARDLRARSMLAQTLLTLWRLEEAREEFEAVNAGLEAREFEGQEAIEIDGFAKAHRVHHAELLVSLGDLAGAEAQLRAVVAAYAADGQGDSAPVANLLVNLAFVVSEQNRDDEAVALYERSLELMERNYEPGGLNWFAPHAGLGRVAFFRGDLDEAEARLSKALAIQREHQPLHLQTATTLAMLSHVLLGRRLYDQALDLQLESLAILEATVPLDHDERTVGLENLQVLLVKSAATPCWEPLLDRATAWLEARGHEAEAEDLRSAVHAAVSAE